MQGDGITVDFIDVILGTLKDAGWSTGALTLGSGGGLLQKGNRDTQKFAFKASAAKIDGEWVDVYKDLVSDSGKKSKRGRLKLIIDEAQHFRTVRQEEFPSVPCQLREVYRDGDILLRDTWETVRERLDAATPVVLPPSKLS